MCLLRLMQDEILDIRMGAAEVYCRNKLMQESAVHPSICVELILDELVSHSKLGCDQIEMYLESIQKEKLSAANANGEDRLFDRSEANPFLESFVIEESLKRAKGEDTSEWSLLDYFSEIGLHL